MYLDKNVDKSAVPGAGAATPKDPNVAVIKAKNVKDWPVRNNGGVQMVGDFVMKPGFKAHYVYMTGVNQAPGYETDGEVDMEGIMQKFIATHPGDTLEAHEFFQNNLGEDLIVIYGSCSDDGKRVYGTKCSPMRLKNTFKSDKDGNQHSFSFEQIQKTRFVPGFYNGNIPYAAPVATTTAIAFAAANESQQYKVEALAVTAAISVDSIDLPAGTIVTLIGSGGVDPATMASGDLTGANALLTAPWVALENATITLEVFDDGADITLVEKART